MAATQIPLTFRLAPLPTGFVGNPQQLASAIVARLTAVSANTLSFFASGSVAPTSNVGPWLKNDQTWYVWSDTLATYVPEIIEAQSLGYTFSAAAPDQTYYKLWIKLDGAGDPMGIFTYANGAWKDIYASVIANYPTQSQVTAEIATAVGNQSKYPFSATKFVNQVVASNGSADDLVFNTTEYDPDSVYSNVTSKFTAPVTGIYNFRVGVLLGLSSGTPTGISFTLALIVNGVSTVGLALFGAGNDTSGRTIYLERSVRLTAGQIVGGQLGISTTGASNWEIDTNSGGNYFQGNLIQAV